MRIDDRLAVLDLKRVEPMLYFTLAPEGVGKPVDATIARIEAAG